MSDETISSDDFQQDAEEAGRLLREHGFQRAPQFEVASPTVVSVVYVGENIAFAFTLDVRDQGIDLTVTRYRGGKLVPNWEGGYCSSLTGHLIRQCGFRGKPVPPASLSPSASRAKRSLSGLVNLLNLPCASGLLADEADALPR